MSFSFSSLVRLLVLMAVGTTMLAVGLSRLDPPRPGWRTRRPSNHVNINEYFILDAERRPRWLDVETGRVAAYPLEGGDVLEEATCSPWVDEKGERQVVGRWSSRTENGPMAMSRDFGLARYTFPGGRLIDQISTEIVPVGPARWFPGTVARVLFASGDGTLYHYAFEPEPWIKAADPEARGDSKPRPLAWKCPRPGVGSVFISDVAWPDDPRMGGCVVVSLREQVLDPEGVRSFSRTQLWWLKLNFAGTEIVECGRLLQSDGDTDQRSPSVAALPGGRLVLAYLFQRSGRSTWELRATPVDFDADRRIPRARDSESVTLAEACQPSQPCFSPDGRWISAITGATASQSRITRISTGRLVNPAS